MLKLFILKLKYKFDIISNIFDKIDRFIYNT